MSYTYPGIYIEEQQAAGAIQPIGTSTAAFIGVAAQGDPFDPTYISSWDEFRARFGSAPTSGAYLWYAVRGFYQNGGKQAYIVRVSTGAADTVEILDSRGASGSGEPMLMVTATQLGRQAADPISVTIDHTDNVVGGVYIPTETVVGGSTTDRILLQVDPANPDDGLKFRTGNRIRVGAADATVRITQPGVIILQAPLAAAPTAGTVVQLAPLQPGVSTIRIIGDDAGIIGPGSLIVLDFPATGGAAASLETHLVKSVEQERIAPDVVTYRVTLDDPLDLNAADYDLSLVSGGSVPVNVLDFSLRIFNGTRTDGPYEHLSMDRRHPRYAPLLIAAAQERQRLAALQADPPVPNWRPLAIVRAALIPSAAPAESQRPEANTFGLVGGSNDDPANLNQGHYTRALETLEVVDDVNFIATPDSAANADHTAIQQALLAHCEMMRDRVAIFDSQFGQDADAVIDLAAQLRSRLGFGALYYPWVIVPHPDRGTLPVPPSGHVAGVYAQADITRGVHKAPANFTLNNASGVTVTMNDVAQGRLNMENINVLRIFPGQARPIVWGARTTSPKGETAWQYVNIRRLMLFIEESIEEGIRWAVFEPNNTRLWKQLDRTITGFLTSVWRSGALFGDRARDAFYVRIDEALNPEHERALGRLFIEIGVRPTYPAEFIVVRIGLWQGGSEVEE